MRAIFLRSVPLLAFLVAWAACGDAEPSGPTPSGPVVASIEVTAALDTLTSLGQTVQLQAIAYDADGAVVDGVAVEWTSSAADVVIVGPDGRAESLANGVAQISASAAGVTGSASLVVAQAVATVTVSPASATLVTAGATQQFTAAAADANGNPVADAVMVWQSSDHSIAIVDGGGSATARSTGEATITAAAQGVPGTATLIVDQNADRLAFLAEPGDAVAGGALSPAVQVEIRDAGGARVRDANAAITLSLAANPGGAQLGGTRVVNAVDGVATFSGLWLDRVSAGYAIEASAAGMASATSAPFAVSPGAAARLAFAVPPADVEGGAPLPVTVNVEDAYGNVVTTAGYAVTLELSPTDMDFALNGTTTMATAAGVAVFDDLSLDNPHADLRIEASAPGLPTVHSDPFDVGVTFVSLGAGTNTCGVSTSSLPYCWGYNWGGMLGVGDHGVGPEFVVATPVRVLGDLRVTAMTGGNGYQCALATDQAAWCWGFNGGGQVGDGTDTDVPEPTPVLGGHAFIDIDAGVFHTCALRTDSVLFCWGRNSDGQLGVGSAITASFEPVEVTGHTFTEVSASWQFTCALDASQHAWCWGSGSNGRFGNGAETDSAFPTLTTDSLAFRDIDTGYHHTCALGVDDRIYCWGFNNDGQVGDATTSTRLSPIRIPGTTAFTAVTLGNYHSCALDENGAAWCWGSNQYGQVGADLPLGTAFLEPKRVAGGLTFTSLVAGDFRTCGTTADGAWCWGDNESGQLGNDGRLPSNVPVRVRDQS